MKAKLPLISGISIAVLSVFALVGYITDPSEMFLANVSDVLGSLFALAMGGFLIYRYFESKKESEKSLNITPDTIEDVDALEQKQNRIFGYYIATAIFGSIELWIMNDYMAGLSSLINIDMIFDLLMSSALGILMVMMFMGKRVSKPLLYTVIVYAIGSMLISFARNEWTTAVAMALFAFYFIFALVKPLNRKNYKISHFFILPAMIVLSLVVTSFDLIKIDKLWEKFVDTEQLYVNLNSDTSIAYTQFLENDTPTQGDIQDIKAKQEKSTQKIGEIETILHSLTEEYKKEYTTESQILTFKTIDLNLEYYAAIRAQGEKVKEMMDYSMSLDFDNLTEEQINTLSEMRRNVDSFGTQLNDIAFKMNKNQEEIDN